MLTDAEIAKEAVINGTEFEALKLIYLDKAIRKMGPHGCIVCGRTISANKRYCKVCSNTPGSKRMVTLK